MSNLGKRIFKNDFPMNYKKYVLLSSDEFFLSFFEEIFEKLLWSEIIKLGHFLYILFYDVLN